MFSQREVALGRKECEYNGGKNFLLGPQLGIINIYFKETPMRYEQIEQNKPSRGLSQLYVL